MSWGERAQIKELQQAIREIQSVACTCAGPTICEVCKIAERVLGRA